MAAKLDSADSDVVDDAVQSFCLHDDKGVKVIIITKQHKTICNSFIILRKVMNENDYKSINISSQEFLFDYTFFLVKFFISPSKLLLLFCWD